MAIASAEAIGYIFAEESGLDEKEIGSLRYTLRAEMNEPAECSLDLCRLVERAYGGFRTLRSALEKRNTVNVRGELELGVPLSALATNVLELEKCWQIVSKTLPTHDRMIYWSVVMLHWSRRRTAARFKTDEVNVQRVIRRVSEQLAEVIFA